MAVSISYQPNAMLLGQAAYDTGLGEYLLQEQARQQAEQAAAQRQATVAQAGLRPPSQGRGGRDDYLARYAIMQRGALAEQENANQLAALDMRGQYALAEQNMRGQFGLQHEMMQQAGQNQREQWGNVSQSEIARRALIEKQMASDWQNIQKHLPYLNQAERDELIGKYHDRYRDAGMPMPVELPPQAIPEWMDPQAQWDKVHRFQQEQPDVYGNTLFVPDENGMPSIMRGAPQYSQTPAGMKAQQEAELHKVEVQNQAKDKQAEAKMYRDAVSDELEFKSKANLDYLKQLSDYNSMRAKYLKDIGDLRKQVAAGKVAEPGETPADMSEVENAIKEMVAAYKSLTPPPPPSEMGQPGPMSQGGVPQPLNPGAAPPQPTTPGVGGEQSAQLPAYTPGPKLANPPVLPTPGITGPTAYGDDGDVYLSNYGSFPGNDPDRGTSSQITSTKLRLGGDVLDPIVRSDNVVLLDKDPKIAKKQLAAIPKGKGFKFLAPDGTIRIVQ